AEPGLKAYQSRYLLVDFAPRIQPLRGPVRESPVLRVEGEAVVDKIRDVDQGARGVVRLFLGNAEPVFGPRPIQNSLAAVGIANPLVESEHAEKGPPVQQFAQHRDRHVVVDGLCGWVHRESRSKVQPRCTGYSLATLS